MTTTKAILAVVLAVTSFLVVDLLRFRGAHPELIQAEQRRSLPNFVAENIGGEVYEIVDRQVQPTVLNFWATWCIPCREEIPWFNETHKLYGDQVEMISVALDHDGWDSVVPFVDEYEIEYSVLIADGQLIRDKFGMSTIPFTFLVDSQNRIASVLPGGTSEDKYFRLVERLIGEDDDR